jgi:phospholipase/lecithinase/hemolysin
MNNAKAKQRAITLAGVMALTYLLPSQAIAQTYSKTYSSLNIFGDSLVDEGNLFNLTGFPPSPPYAQKLSNGDIWVEQFAASFGLDPLPSTTVLPGIFNGTALPPADGINFGLAGSLTSDINVGSPLLPGLQQQIQTFGALNALVPADPNALYILLAGGNDYNEAVSNPSGISLDDLPDQVSDNLTTATAALIGAGAKHLLVGNLPDLGLLPFADFLNQFNPQSASLLTGLSSQHNQLLSQKLTALEATSGAQITQLDLEGLFAEAISNPAKFGFSNVEESCLINAQPGFVFEGVCDNPDEFLFWDDVHVTEKGNLAIAQLAIDTLAEKDSQSVPEPTGVLVWLIGGSAFILRSSSRLNRRLNWHLDNQRSVTDTGL